MGKISKLKAGVIAVVAAISGFLGAWGGASGTSKAWRRVGIAVLLCLVGLAFKNYWAILIGAWSGVMSIGYGIPDPGWPEDPDADSGSTLGRFWYKITGKSQFYSDLMTRMTLGVIYSSVLVIIGILSHKTATLILSVPLCLIATTLSFVWRVFGTYKLFGKELTWDETIVYFLLGLAGIGQLIV